jgi:hypothetical protein
VDYVGLFIPVNNTTSIGVNSVEDMDIGFQIGLGLNVPIGAANFLVDIRYVSSLTDPVVNADFYRVIGEGDDSHHRDYLRRLLQSSVLFLLRIRVPVRSAYQRGDAIA